MRAGVLPGGDEICHGYHVWDAPEHPSECIRCGFIDHPPRDREIGCPTCSGPIRETVGMVCQTCGTNYGAGV